MVTGHANAEPVVHEPVLDLTTLRCCQRRVEPVVPDRHGLHGLHNREKRRGFQLSSRATANISATARSASSARREALPESLNSNPSGYMRSPRQLRKYSPISTGCPRIVSTRAVRFASSPRASGSPAITHPYLNPLESRAWVLVPTGI